MITFVRTNVSFKERIKQVATTTTRAAETNFQTKAISVSLCRHHVHVLPFYSKNVGVWVHFEGVIALLWYELWMNQRLKNSCKIMLREMESSEIKLPLCGFVFALCLQLFTVDYLELALIWTLGFAFLLSLLLFASSILFSHLFLFMCICVGPHLSRTSFVDLDRLSIQNTMLLGYLYGTSGLLIEVMNRIEMINFIVWIKWEIDRMSFILKWELLLWDRSFKSIKYVNILK